MTMQMKARSMRRIHEELVRVELEPITPNADTAKGSQPTTTLTVEVNPKTPLGQRLLAATWDASILTWRLDDKDDDAVPPVTEARWKEIAQERGDMLDDLSRQLAEARAEVVALRGCVCAGRECNAKKWMSEIPAADPRIT